MHKHRQTVHIPKGHARNMPYPTTAATPGHPIRNTQPYLNHETLTQDQQARHLGVPQESVLNLGHPCPVSAVMDNPVGQPTEYTQGPAKRSLRESDRAGQGQYSNFPDPKSGLSTDFESLRNWQHFASANTEVTCGEGHSHAPDRHQRAHADYRENQPENHHLSGKHPSDHVKPEKLQPIGGRLKPLVGE